MSIRYDKLWKLLIDKKLTKTELQTMIGCSPNTMSAMGKDEYVSMKTIDKICNVLNCEISDIIEHIKDEAGK